MKRFFVAVAFMAMGCEMSQTQSIGKCGGDVAEAGAPFKISDGVGGTGGEGGADGGAAPLVGPGGPCDVDTDCADALCVASKNSFSYGYCYAPSMVGCIVVTDPAPQKANCAAMTKRLYVCGDSEDVAKWGQNCVVTDVGALGESYHCCDKP